MRLAEKLMLQSWHLLDYDWTPLNWNPCCKPNVWHCYHWISKLINMFGCMIWSCVNAGLCELIHLMVTINLLQTISINPRIVSAKSGFTATIYWGVACVLDLLLQMCLIIALGCVMIFWICHCQNWLWHLAVWQWCVVVYACDTVHGIDV